MMQKEINEGNRLMLQRQEHFYKAAEYVAAGFSESAEVQKVVLFGSVARPLTTEVPRFREFRRDGVAILHECKDVDLAVWVSNLECLKKIQKSRVHALNRLFEEKQIGVAHHQVDVFIMEPVTNRYLGRLCWFSSCPKRKEDCQVPDCGQPRFLRQHEGFEFDFNGLEETSSVTLFER